MNFKELNNLLEAFSQYKYNIPKDKKQLLFDFYMLTGLKVPNNDKLRTAYLDARNTIVEYLVKHLKESLFFAISAEFRHVFKSNSSDKLKKFFNKLGYKDFIKKYATTYGLKQSNYGEFLDDDREQLVNRFKESSRGYQDSYEALKKTKLPDKKIIELARIAFLKLEWASAYGGKSWAGIADGWLMLDKAKSINDKIIAIDHAYDLQHNTDTVFNKLKNYYKSGYSWIKKSLDKKANLKELFEIYNDISIGLKSFAAAVIKDTENKTLEMFLGKGENIGIEKNKMYINYTGKIKYEYENKIYIFHAKNAQFKYDDKLYLYRGKINGEINSVNCIFCQLIDGIWKNGIWKDGIWENGLWYNGTWENGTWYNGTWRDGTWENGIWKDGTWKNGRWENGTWNNGTWKNGKWIFGDWLDGIWEKGIWKRGDFKTGLWKDGVWLDGVWLNGTWNNGRFYDGIWNNGTWKNGMWFNGTWNNGIWEQGLIYDPDKKGNYEDNWKWDGKFVKSPINPKDYFKK